MCFDSDSSPPIPPISGAAVTHRDLVLETSDGNRFAAFVAIPEETGRAGVVILPDVRGLYRFYEELALRFAERGHRAVAIDYFGRTAGPEKRGDDFEYLLHVRQTTPDGVQRDVASAIAFLRVAEEAPDAVFTVGFCFGGRHSWLAAAGGHGLAGVIGFYGKPGPGHTRDDDSPGPTQRAAEMKAPILALMGGDDPGIAVEDVETFGEALDKAGVEHEVVVYPGAPHSFFDRKYEEFASESEDAWQRVLQFIERRG
jgi:carboxymethylenebutenolidase